MNINRINSQNPVNILIFNFDENGNEYNNYNLGSFISDVNLKIPNIIFICTQNSISRTDKHLQHLIYHRNKKTKEVVTILPLQYKLFSKVDATRQSDLKKIYYKNLKNVRTRIYYNTDNVYVDTVFDKFANKSSKKRGILNFSNNSIDENEQKYNGNINNDKNIIIKKYKYRRYTVIGENGRTGKGGIMTSIVFKMDKLEYQYIVCNYNFNNNNIQPKFNEIIKIENIKLDSSKKVRTEKTVTIRNTFSQGNNINIDNREHNNENRSSINKSESPIIFIYFVSINNNIEYNKYVSGSKNNIIKLSGKKKDNPSEYSYKVIYTQISPHNVSSLLHHNQYFRNTNIQSLYKNKVFEYMYKTLKKQNISNIPEHIIQEAINKAIENKKLNYNNNGQQIIRISCPICNFGMNLEKACGVTRCCNTRNKQTLIDLCNKIDNKSHATKEECNELRQTYPNACLTPLLILTIDYEEYKDINVCLSTLPYYF